MLQGWLHSSSGAEAGRRGKAGARCGSAPCPHELSTAVPRYLELFPDQHWSMSSYDPKERRKLATHAEGDLDLNFQELQYPSLDLAEVRARCDEEVSIERLYVPWGAMGRLPWKPWKDGEG
eukprot:Skav203424  [mRNA]  locus=scaffold1743:414124:416060:- [translate_table: standard]